MTMHSSKGLEFPVVAISGLGYLPAKGQSEAVEAKLLYVAMTCSTDILLLTSHNRGSEFTERICNQEIIAEAQLVTTKSVNFIKLTCYSLTNKIKTL